MYTFWYSLFGLLIASNFAFQNKYTVVQENVTLEYVDDNVLDTTVGIYKLNETINALNMSIKLKIDLPDDGKAYVSAFKWMNNDYSLALIQFGRTFKAGLEMESFDLQTLFLDFVRPPLVWPLQKGIMYHCIGWSPDSTKFPPNLPEGKWKVEVIFAFGNKTNFMVANWYVNLVYKKL